MTVNQNKIKFKCNFVVIIMTSQKVHKLHTCNIQLQTTTVKTTATSLQTNEEKERKQLGLMQWFEALG